MEKRVSPLAARIAIFRTRLKSFAREMVVGIQRTARSPLKNQAYDFGVVIMDPEGGMMEADEFRALFPFAIHPGEVAACSAFAIATALAAAVLPARAAARLAPGEAIRLSR